MGKDAKFGLIMVCVAVVMLIAFCAAVGLAVLSETDSGNARQAAGSGPVNSPLVRKAMSERAAISGTRTAAHDSPEYVVYEYFRAIEARDVDRLFSLGSRAMMDQQMARKKTLSVEEFKAKWATELNKLASDTERVYGKGWSKMINVLGATRINDQVRLKVTTGYETEPVSVYVVKEDGQWKMQTWIFD